ncbi:aminotransferase class V-fold PLP-dependent enzyme [Chromobacterium alticapitis]|uniref:Aminotransferase n=1 Tax=Chromobacterium alticapitis TaxID=2073169 RepID=A0A2S5DBL8_9NEIS|nr:aminotransferase class V-fold PLP-dependent enzyme [Chromobacterium alticapitis]POZ60463.1 aminotransferase [Chromobacterium alticapitis]
MQPFSPSVLHALRAATPGLENSAYFNYAAQAPVSAKTLAVAQRLQNEESARWPHLGAPMREQTEIARTALAALLSADRDEIALTGGNSHGWGLAFAAMGPWRAGDRILVGRHEWGGNLAAMALCAGQAGARIETIPCDAQGAVDAAALEAMLDARVKMIALTWLPANGGLINPAAAIGRIARRHGIPYFIDAAQAVGQLPIDVEKLGCDVLSGAGRKALRGPKGTGFLYVRRDFLPRLSPVFADRLSALTDQDGAASWRAGAARFENAEASQALHGGLANAVEEALALGLENIRAATDAAAQSLRARLAAIPGVAMADLGRDHSGLVSFQMDGIAADAAARRLAERGVTVAASPAFYTPLDMQSRRLDQLIRASVSYLTLDEEIERLANAVETLRR